MPYSFLNSRRTGRDGDRSNRHRRESVGGCSGRARPLCARLSCLRSSRGFPICLPWPIVGPDRRSWAGAPATAAAAAAEGTAGEAAAALAVRLAHQAGTDAAGPAAGLDHPGQSSSNVEAQVHSGTSADMFRRLSCTNRGRRMSLRRQWAGRRRAFHQKPAERARPLRREEWPLL
ncbi:hypothetical protein ABID21_002189 [Pseudorhizobium tarimense]|uniref:Uncharacterized protein n=1 Tax=Pseudorhizobium tarimense TaxID=1079109 RepID=A0ABV2H6M6_9HYPH